MNRTENFQLCQWEPEDRILRSDFVADNAKLDTALTAHRDALAGLAVSDAGKQEKVTASGVLAGDGAGHVDAAGAAELYTLMSSLAAVTDPVDADKLLLADVSGETAGTVTLDSLMSSLRLKSAVTGSGKCSYVSGTQVFTFTFSLPFPPSFLIITGGYGGRSVKALVPRAAGGDMPVGVETYLNGSVTEVVLGSAPLFSFSFSGNTVTITGKQNGNTSYILNTTLHYLAFK